MGINLPITKKPSDGYDTAEWFANSLSGNDVGDRIGKPKDLRPGDLVFFDRTYGNWGRGVITHVGVYVGDGMMVDRSTSSAPVRMRSMEGTFPGKFTHGVRPHALKAKTRGTGAPARRSVAVGRPPGPSAVHLPGGSYIENGQLYTNTGRRMDARKAYSRNSPLRIDTSSPYKRDYPAKNDNKANYGYDALKKDKRFANDVAWAANQLKIPAQWLADVMHYESAGTFSPGKWGGAGGNYVGLIQFGPGAAQDMGVSQQSLANMSRSEQMKYVVKYLKMRPGTLDTIAHLYAKINAGNSLNVRQALGMSDGNGTIAQHISRFGRSVGRRYRTAGADHKRMTPSHVHTKFRHNCSLCNGLQNANSFVPHYAPLD